MLRVGKDVGQIRFSYAGRKYRWYGHYKGSPYKEHLEVNALPPVLMILYSEIFLQGEWMHLPNTH